MEHQFSHVLLPSLAYRYLWNVLPISIQVLSVSNPLWWQPGVHSGRRAWVKLNMVSAQTEHVWNPDFQGGASIINLPIPHLLGTLVDGSKLLWQLPWALFSTYRTCCSALKKSLYAYQPNQWTQMPGGWEQVLGGSGGQWRDKNICNTLISKGKKSHCISRAIPHLCHHPGTVQAPWWLLLLCIQPTISTQGSAARSHTRARAPTSWSPGVVSALGAPMWKMVRTISGTCRWTWMSFHISWPPCEGLFMVIHFLASHGSNYRVNPFRTVQLSM